MWLRVLLVGLCVSYACAAHAQGAVGKAMLPLMDFDRLHPVLLQRCEAAAPETVPALKQAIDAWRKDHYVPQRLLQTYAMVELAAKQGQADISQQKAVIKMLQDASVEKFTKETAAMDAEKLRQLCERYPNELAVPEMNFLQIQRGKKAEIDAAIAAGKQRKENTQ
ncbi:MAG: hypothetical protein ACRCV9_20085 [Burkholderiaceae bacterium]